MNRILCGDVRERLAELPDESVHCVVTSPPYWGLRDYGVAGQIGLEPTTEEYLAKMVDVFREVRRVLRRDGTLWLNLGDSYAASGKGGGGNSIQPTNLGSLLVAPYVRSGLPAKNLLGQAWRVAFALQEAGWILRSDIIWHKPNPMPESVQDRPTRAHEYLFLLTKSGSSIYWTHRGGMGTRAQPKPDYRYIHQETGEEVLALPTGAVPSEWQRVNLWRGHDYFYDTDAIREEPVQPWHAPEIASRVPDRRDYEMPDKQRGHTRRHAGFNDRWDAMTRASQVARGANKRSVWTIASQPYTGAHFATFPEALVEPCIRAGTSERGVCPECGAPWRRKVNRQFLSQDDSSPERAVRDGMDASNGWNGFPRGTTNSTTVGWAPSCEHGGGEPVPAVVLDPFMGSGTVALVALKLQRRYIGIELNPEYVAMAEGRLRAEVPLLMEAAT